jgi:ribosome-associated toxin RatA of RatAB toxin-antitoxin module
MRRVDRTALVPYSPEQMFVLVTDIESYPQFVPWVASAQLVARTDHEVIGKLQMERSGIRETFTTRNTLKSPHEIVLTLVDGPSRKLQGLWKFEDLQGRGTRVSLTVEFEFANPMLSLLLSRTFEKSCAELVDAFVARARSVYGQS